MFVFTIPDNNKAMSQCMMWNNNHIMVINTRVNICCFVFNLEKNIHYKSIKAEL